MAFIPYIHFSGTCAEAMAFYCKVFNGTDLQMMKFSEMPAEAGGFPSDLIMHSQFMAAGGMMMASDTPPSMPVGKQQAVSVMIDPPTVAEGRRLFDALTEGGTVIMPFSPTSWSPGFGMMEDKFGTHWIIGTQPAA
jgi:PhnB protein